MSLVWGGGTGSMGTTGEQWSSVYDDRIANNAGGSPLVVHCHGHGQDATIIRPNTSGLVTTWAYTMETLAKAGYIVLGIDAGGTAPWGNDTAMSSIGAAITTAQAGTGPVKARSGKVALSGYSMGGINALNYLKRNASQVACVGLIDPGTDLDFFEGGGHFPDVDTAYGGAYSANAVGHKVMPDAAAIGGLGVPIKIWHLPDPLDTTIPHTQSTQFQAAAGAQVTVVSPDAASTMNHSIASLAVDPEAFAAWFASHLTVWTGMGRTPLGTSMGN